MAARCSVKGLGIAVVFASVTIGGGLMMGTFVSVGLGLIIGSTLLLFALHGAWQVARGLAEFAEPVPLEPRVRARTDGQASLEWPSMGLRVEAQAGVLREPELEVNAAGQPIRAPIDEGPEAAREALEVLGVDPGASRAEG